ncbi:Carbonic anhydrase, partial [Operophtera brumata]
MCNKGRRQSPVNIEPERLLFDPWLRDIQLTSAVGPSPTDTSSRRYTSTTAWRIIEGSSYPIKHLALSSLLPNTQQYLTYEGSTTHPGCWETAVWIIFNKPIYVSKQE